MSAALKNALRLDQHNNELSKLSRANVFDPRIDRAPVALAPWDDSYHTGNLYGGITPDQMFPSFEIRSAYPGYSMIAHPVSRRGYDGDRQYDVIDPHLTNTNIQKVPDVWHPRTPSVNIVRPW